MRKLKSDADGGGSDHISGVDDEMDDKDREKETTVIWSAVNKGMIFWMITSMVTQ